MLLKIAPGRAGRFDRASRRDVVGRDGVGKETEDAGFLDVFCFRQVDRHTFEVGRVLHVGGGRRPGIGLGAAHRDILPVLVALEDVAIALSEHFRRHGLAHHVGDFLGRWPDVLQVDVIAVLVLAERIAGQIDVQRACNRIGHDQRRGGEIVRAHILADTAFEVTVT